MRSAEDSELEGDKPASTVKVRGSDLRLLPAAAATWIGVIAGLRVGGAIWEHWAVILAALMLLTMLRVRGLRATAVAVLALCLAFLVGSTATHTLENDPLRGAAAEGKHASVVGAVADFPTESRVPWKKETLETVLRATSVEVGDTHFVSSAELQLDITGLRAPGLTAAREVPKGTVLEVTGTLAEPSFRRGAEVARMSVDSFVIIRAAPAWQRAVGRLRFEMSEVTRDASGALGPLITGMAIGDDAGLHRRVKQAMLTTSLTHLTAVSGSHIAISLAVIHALFRGRPKLQASLVGLFLILVLAVVGAEPSVVRATFMSALAAWGIFRRRPGQPLALLFVVVIVVLLWSPSSALSLGFALSATATLGILTLGRLLVGTTKMLIDARLPGLDGVALRVLLAVADISAISTSAFVVGLPILVLVNPWIPTWGIIANLAVAPIVAPLTYLGLAVAVCAVPWPAAAYVLSAVAAPLAGWMETVALAIAEWPLARLPWPQGPAAALLLACLLLLGVGATIAGTSTLGTPLRFLTPRSRGSELQ